MKTLLSCGLVIVLAGIIMFGCTAQEPVAPMTLNNAGGPGGFNEFGYNYTARVFVGTGESWALAKGLPPDYMDPYSADKLVMKWNAEWDRGNDEGWSNPPYNAWTNNEWNGAFPGGSGEVWIYKIKWVGNFAPGPGPNGGYMIWGQFEVIMSHGTVANEHFWDAHAKPAGYRFP